MGNVDTFGWESWTTCTNIWAVSSQGQTLPLCCPSKEQGTTNVTPGPFPLKLLSWGPTFLFTHLHKEQSKKLWLYLLGPVLVFEPGCSLITVGMYWIFCLNNVQHVTRATFLLTVSHDYYSGAGKKLFHFSSPVGNFELLAAGKAQVCRSPQTSSTYSRVMNQSGPDGTIHLEQDQNNCPTCSASCKSICIMMHH